MKESFEEKYSEQEARAEADAMTDLVGENGKAEDYDAAEELVEESKEEESESSEQKPEDDWFKEMTVSEVPEKDAPSNEEWLKGMTTEEVPQEEEETTLFSEEKKEQEEVVEKKEEVEVEPLSVQPVWYDKVREGLPSEGGSAGKYEPYRFPEEKYEPYRFPEEKAATEMKEKEAQEKIVAREEAEKIVAEMPEKERASLAKGLLGLGFRLQEFKGKVFEKAFTSIAEKMGTRDVEGSLEDKSFTKRLFESLGSKFSETAKKAQKDREQFNEKGSVKKGALSVATLAGNVALYGRTVVGLGTPLGSVTTVAMAVGAGAEGVKEAHLASKDVVQEGRVHDIEQAQNEAAALYEDAKTKAENGIVMKEQLMQAYKERLPKDLVDRLSKDIKTEGFFAKCGQLIAHKNIDLSVQKIQNKLEKIEKNGTYSKEKREKEKAQIIAKYDKFLRDMDRIVGNSGTVDMIAYGSRLAERGGKATAGIMAVETIVESAVAGAQALEAFNTDINGIDEGVPAGALDPQVVKETFGSFSEKMIGADGGVTPDDVALAEKATALGLKAEDFNTFQGSPVTLSHMINGAEGLSQEKGAELVKESLESPDVIENAEEVEIRPDDVEPQELPAEEIPQDPIDKLTETRAQETAIDTMQKTYAPEELKQAQIPGETEVPPIDGRTPEERIAPDAWDKDLENKKFVIHEDAQDDIEPQEQEAPAQEVPSREVPPPEHLSEVPEQIEETAILEKVGEHGYSYKGAEGDFIGKFSYNESNEIIGFRHEGNTKIGGADSLKDSTLNEGWRAKILGEKGAYLAGQKIEASARDLGIRQRILTVMEKAGDKDTKEYQFLKKTIATRIELLEKTYGDIFK